MRRIRVFFFFLLLCFSLNGVSSDRGGSLEDFRTFAQAKNAIRHLVGSIEHLEKTDHAALSRETSPLYENIKRAASTEQMRKQASAFQAEMETLEARIRNEIERKQKRLPVRGEGPGVKGSTVDFSFVGNLKTHQGQVVASCNSIIRNFLSRASKSAAIQLFDYEIPKHMVSQVQAAHKRGLSFVRSDPQLNAVVLIYSLEALGERGPKNLSQSGFSAFQKLIWKLREAGVPQEKVQGVFSFLGEEMVQDIAGVWSP